jgi:hypothetical protein
MGSDDDDVEHVAREMIDHHSGDVAARTARALAEIAASVRGDMLSAATWRDIADTIERLRPKP